jgi:hypothetical protein
MEAPPSKVTIASKNARIGNEIGAKIGSVRAAQNSDYQQLPGVMLVNMAKNHLGTRWGQPEPHRRV